ncbi:MAG: hypothetical protein HQ517_11125 [SAR324 cluster bacterium]|nr:hypothetical protein [SAR324 cluster bacterium]
MKNSDTAQFEQWKIEIHEAVGSLGHLLLDFVPDLVPVLGRTLSGKPLAQILIGCSRNCPIRRKCGS